jgi:Ser-tRNA(Ala) deacylase AlaX
MVDNTTTNKSRKDYCPEMHTAEHILNQTMVRMFGCKRSMNAHIEKKKSKCDYILDEKPADEKLQDVERTVNEIIGKNLPVTIDFVSRNEAELLADLSKLPGDASETIRIVRVGDYDVCACIGEHVENTAEIGHFRFLNCDYENGRLRVRFTVNKL